MLLVTRGLMRIAPTSVRADVSRDTEVCLDFTLPTTGPHVIHLHDGTLEFRERRRGDRPDIVMRSSATVSAQLLYQRIGPLTAARRGLRVVGGRRPWRALQLMSFSNSPSPNRGP